MKLDVKTEKLEKSRVKLTVTIDKDEVNQEYQTILEDIQTKVQIPGFRKGKAPKNVIEMKYKEGILSEVTSNLIDKSYKEIFDNLEFKPISTSIPTLENVSKVKIGENFTYNLFYDRYPDVEIGDYKNVEIEKEIVEVSENDVKEEIDNYLVEFSSIEEKDGKAEKGDIVLVEYSVFENNTEIYSNSNEFVHIGKNYDKYEIGDNLIGLTKGSKKEFTKKYDKNHSKFPSKEYKFKVEVKEIKTEKKPELTDELAKQFDKTVNNKEEFINKVKENLTNYANDMTKIRALDKIFEKLLPTFKGDIPESMIQSQLDSYYKEILHRAGGDEKKALNILNLQGHTKQSFYDSNREKAITAIKKSLIINYIIEKEKIQATEEDLKQHIGKFAKFYGLKTDDLYENYKKNDQLSIFENEVKVDKAYDLLVNSAKVKKTKKITLKDIDENK